MNRHCIPKALLVGIALTFPGAWLPCTALLNAREREDSKRMLIVHSYDRNFIPFSDVATSFRHHLTESPKEHLEIHEASLARARFEGEEREVPLLNFLAATFQSDPPDLVVPIGAPAAQFCLRHRDALFPGAPVLLLGVDKIRLPGLIEQPAVASIGLDLDLAVPIRNIRELLPRVEQIHVVTGVSPFERFWEAALRQAWVEFEGDVQIHWLSGLSIAEVTEAASRLPPRSAVLVITMNEDAGGLVHEGVSALKTIRAASTAPVFGCFPSQLGSGIIGGSLCPMTEVGREGAAAALQILDGTPPGQIPRRQLPFGARIYDGRELDAWKIPKAAIPTDASVLFKPPSLWESHRDSLIFGLLLIAFQSVLIGMLLHSRRRTRISEGRVKLAADAARIGFWERNPDSETIDATEPWRNLFGMTSTGDIHLDDVVMRIHPADRERIRRAVENAIQDGGEFSIEHRVLDPDGGIRWIHTQGSAFNGRNGRGFALRGASTDVTDRRESEATVALQRAELAHLSRVSSLGVLTGALAHELNQPLGIILSNAQAAEDMLQGDAPDLDELREIMADIISEDRRAGQVIARLRALLQRGETRAQRVAIARCVEDVEQLTRNDLAGRGITLNVDGDEDVPDVWIDPVHLQQILLNLIVNARDAMNENAPEDREITIRSARDESTPGQVRISVSDRGPGLPDDPEVVFAPFYTTKGDGLGMGLAICRTLAAAHGGRLQAEPSGERGATFVLTLPTTTPSA